MSEHHTFFIIKPDAVRQNLVMPILNELAEFTLIMLRRQHLLITHVQELYAEHKAQPWYEDQVNFMLSGVAVTGILEGGPDVVQSVRRVVGVTDSAMARPYTIRGRWGSKTVMRENCIHASSSDDDAKREIEIFFGWP